MSIENFGILHGLNNTKIPEEDIVKAYESANEGNLISHLKKQEHYLKLSDRKVSNEMNLIDLKGCYSGHFVYPIKQLKEASKNLYNYLHILDNENCRGIAVAPIPNNNLGKTINDRLKRASSVN